MSPEWARAESDLESMKLLPAPVGPEAPPIEGWRRKVLRSQALLESMLAGKPVSVSLLVPNSVPSVAQMAWPPVLAYRTKGVREAP